MKCFFRLIACIVVCVFTARADEGYDDERLPLQSPEARKVIDLLNSGDVDRGLKQAEQLAKKQPGNLELLMLVGMIHAETGEYEKALAAFKKGIRGSEKDLPFILNVARVHATRGELGPGGAYVNGGMRYSPDKRTEAERAEFIRREHLAAAEILEKAIALHPDRIGYQVRRVASLVDGNGAQAAYEAAETYLKNAGSDPRLWLGRARAAAQLGRWTEAKSAAERCLELRPESSEAYIVLATAAKSTGEAAVAQEFERRAKFFSFIRPAFAVKYSKLPQRCSFRRENRSTARS